LIISGDCGANVPSDVGRGTGQSTLRKQPGTAYLVRKITSSPKGKFRVEDEIARTHMQISHAANQLPATSRDGVCVDLARVPDWPTILNSAAHRRLPRYNLHLLRGFMPSTPDFVGAHRDNHTPWGLGRAGLRPEPHATPVDRIVSLGSL
jgi:hypothetical protein